MQCEIKKDGKLFIKSESDIECYALGQWVKNNYPLEKIHTFKMDIEFNWSGVKD
jgi:hypothetical protein